MRYEKEKRKKQARSNKQTRQSNTAHSHVHVHSSSSVFLTCSALDVYIYTCTCMLCLVLTWMYSYLCRWWMRWQVQGSCDELLFIYIQYESKKSFHFCPFRCYLFQIGTDTPFRFVPVSNVKKRTFRSYL